jgi:spermidine/putrescine transport system permease protein
MSEASAPLQTAQLDVTPSLPTPSEDAQEQGGASPLSVTPSLPGAGGSSSSPLSVTPSLPGAGGSSSSPLSVSPSLPGGGSAQSAAPQPNAPAAGGSNLNITITNPDQIQLPPGQTELKLVIQPDQPAKADAGDGLGFFTVFFALVAALIVAPWAQREAGKWVSFVHAFDFVRKNGLVISSYLLIFSGGWIIFMIVLPQLYMLDFSFRFNLPPAEIGGPNDVYTLKNYQYLLFGRESDSDLFNWLHLEVFFKTILASVIVTVIDFALCYPLAYFMAQAVSGRSQRLLFLCLLLPFWVNEILRAFAFKLIFAQQGLINVMLINLGIWDTPFDFFRADVALYTGLTYAYILLMVFPLYNAIESLDHNQIEAARDLGASWWRIHTRVVMPYAKPGIASGCTMVFMLSAGALAAPNILGGPSSLWFTQIIYQWYNTGGNWPQGSAYAFVLLIACIVFVRIMMRVFNVGLGDIAKR